MKHSDEAQAAAIEAGIPTLLRKLTDFCDLNSDHISCDPAVCVELGNGWLPSIHMRNDGNPAKAVAFALDTIDNARVLLIRTKTSRHAHVFGEFERLPIQVISCSSEEDAAVIDSYVDWAQADRLGHLEISPDLLLKMAGHTS